MKRGRGFRGALSAYVNGHDRVWTTERKRGSAAGLPEDPVVEWGAAEVTRTDSGIQVPSTLDFRRGPDIWGERDAGGRRQG